MEEASGRDEWRGYICRAPESICMFRLVEARERESERTSFPTYTLKTQPRLCSCQTQPESSSGCDSLEMKRVAPARAARIRIYIRPHRARVPRTIRATIHCTPRLCIYFSHIYTYVYTARISVLYTFVPRAHNDCV